MGDAPKENWPIPDPLLPHMVSSCPAALNFSMRSLRLSTTNTSPAASRASPPTGPNSPAALPYPPNSPRNVPVGEKCCTTLLSWSATYTLPWASTVIASGNRSTPSARWPMIAAAA